MIENKRFKYVRNTYKHYIHDTEKDGEWKEGYIGTYGEFDLDKLTIELNKRENRINQLNDENEQLKQFQNKVAEIINSHMEDNCCNDYKLEVLKKIWRELDLDKVWFE